MAASVVTKGTKSANPSGRIRIERAVTCVYCHGTFPFFDFCYHKFLFFLYFRIAEIVSPESSKKTSESVKLPPTKQNGHLVQSDEPQETKKSKKAENHDGRQIADPKRKKKSNLFYY